MNIQKILPVNQDERGIISDILTQVPIDAVTIISSKKGVTRGNHYHKETIQWVYLLNGKLQVLSRKEGANENVNSKILEPGYLLKSEPLEHHALKALEDSVFIVLTKGPRCGKDYESDTFRLSAPLKND